MSDFGVWARRDIPLKSLPTSLYTRSAMPRRTAGSGAIQVHPDSKGRVSLGQFAKGVSSFRVTSDAEGRIVLEPFVEIPARDRWLFGNAQALARVRRGLADSGAGRTVSLGSFAKHALERRIAKTRSGR